MAEPILPMTSASMMQAASRGLGKVDLHGRRGVTMLSVDEAEAMALLLASLGLVPTPPGEKPPGILFIPTGFVPKGQ